MSKDKYSAVWLSHSSISDYLKCPRSYFLKNIYKNPNSGRKIQITSPALSLGTVVHNTIDTLTLLPASDRQFLDVDTLTSKYSQFWENVSGKKGGFKTVADEDSAKKRGLKMLSMVCSNPGPLTKPIIKIRQDLPYYWFSEPDNIILCGKIDWLEYLAEKDGVNIIDFKTGKYDEDPESLQLPIYHLLVSRTQSKQVVGAAYWYLDRDSSPTPVDLPDTETAEKILNPIAKKIALARKLNHFSCPQIHGCRACLPFEAVITGKAELVDVRDNKDIYYLS